MFYQEKKSIVNIISTLLISGIYFWYVFQSHPEKGLNTDELLNFWARTLLWLIPVTIVAKIVIHILFGIFNTVASNEPMKSDERDKLIELKSNRNAQMIFGLGFILAMLAIANGMSVNVMFITIISGGVVAEIYENISQLYFYKRGI